MENDLKILRSEDDVITQRSNGAVTEWVSSGASMESLSKNDIMGSNNDLMRSNNDSGLANFNGKIESNHISDDVSKNNDVTSAGSVNIENIAVSLGSNVINGKELTQVLGITDYAKLVNHCGSGSSTFNGSMDSICELLERSASSEMLTLSSSFPSSLPSCVPSTIIILSTNGLSELPSSSCRSPPPSSSSVMSLTSSSQIDILSVSLSSACSKDESELQPAPPLTSPLLPLKSSSSSMAESSLVESQPEVLSSIAIVPSLSSQSASSFIQSPSLPSSSSLLLPTIQPSSVFSESAHQEMSSSTSSLHLAPLSHSLPSTKMLFSEQLISLSSLVASSALSTLSSAQLSPAASTYDKLLPSSSGAVALKHDIQSLSSSEVTSKHDMPPSLSVLSPLKLASQPPPPLKQNRRFPIRSPPQRPMAMNLYDFSPSKESPLKPLRPPKRQSAHLSSSAKNQSSYLSRYRTNNLRRAVLEKTLLEKAGSDRGESSKASAVYLDKSLKTLDAPTVKSQILQTTSDSIPSMQRSHDVHQQQKQTAALPAGNSKPPETKTRITEKAELERFSRRTDLSDDDLSTDLKRKRGRPKKRGRGRPPKVSLDSSQTSSLVTLQQNSKIGSTIKSEDVRPKRSYKKKVADISPGKRTLSPVLTRSSRKKPRQLACDCSATTFPSIAPPPATAKPFVGLAEQEAKPREMPGKCVVVIQGGFLESKKFLRNYVQFSSNDDILFPHITEEDVCFFKLANHFYKEHKDKAYDIFGQEDEEINNMPSCSDFPKNDEKTVPVAKKTPTISKPTTQVKPFSFSVANELRSPSPKSKNRNPRSGATAGDVPVKKGKEHPRKRLISSILRELGDHDNSNRLVSSEESKMETIDSSFEEAHNNLSTSVIDSNDPLMSPTSTYVVTPSQQRSFVTFVTPQKRPRMEDNGYSEEGSGAKRQCFEDRPSLFLSFGSTSCIPEEKFYSFESLVKHSGHPNCFKSSSSSSSTTAPMPTPNADSVDKKTSSFIESEIREKTRSVETLTDESGLLMVQPRCSCMHQCGLQNTYLSAPQRRPTPNDATVSGLVSSRPNSNANSLLALNYPTLLQPNLYPGPFLGQAGPFLLSLPSGDFHQLPVDFREQQPQVLKNSLQQHSPLYRNDGQSSLIPLVVAAPNGYYAVPIATDISDKTRISSNFGQIFVPYVANDGAGSFQVPTYLASEGANSIQVSTSGSTAPPEHEISRDVSCSNSETSLLTTTNGPLSTHLVTSSSLSSNHPQQSFVEMLQESIPVGVVNDTPLNSTDSIGSSRNNDEANSNTKVNNSGNNTLNSSHFSVGASNCDNTSITSLSSSSTYFLSDVANEQSYHNQQANHSLIGHFNHVSTIEGSTNSNSSVNSTSYFPVVNHSIFNHQQSHANFRNTNYVHCNYNNCMPPPTFAPQRARYVPPESYPRQQAFTNLEQQIMPNNSTIISNYTMLTPKHQQQHHYVDTQQTLPQHFNCSSLYPGGVGADFRGSASHPHFFFDGRGKQLTEGFGSSTGSFPNRIHQSSRGGVVRSTTSHEHDASNLWN